MAVTPADIEAYRIVRKALDARKKDRLHFVYTVDVQLSAPAAAKVARRRLKDVAPYREEAAAPLQSVSLPAPCGDGSPAMDAPVIVGAGPAGIFAALTLAARGFRPVVLERGQDVDTRAADIGDFWT
ncbi:FAD-binding protein, partial [bacterium]